MTPIAHAPVAGGDPLASYEKILNGQPFDGVRHFRTCGEANVKNAILSCRKPGSKPWRSHGQASEGAAAQHNPPGDANHDCCGTIRRSPDLGIDTLAGSHPLPVIGSTFE
jgi:hypothetical protein